MITNWTRANRIVATMVPNARPIRIIKTFRAAAHLAIRDACVIKMLMSVHCRRLAAMEPLARTYPAHTNVCAPKAMKAAIARSTLTIALRSHAQTVAHAWMAWATSLAFVWMASRENNAKSISMNARQVSVQKRD